MSKHKKATSCPTKKVTCRVCITGGRQLVPFARYDTARRPYRLAEAIAAVGGVRVESDDGLPQHCCIRCLRMIESAYQVRQLCQESDRKLRETLRPKLKLESLMVVVRREEEVAVPLKVDVVEVKKEKEEDCGATELIFKQEVEESQVQQSVDVSNVKQEIDEWPFVKKEEPQVEQNNDGMEVYESNGLAKEDDENLQLQREDHESSEEDDEVSCSAGENAARKARICCGCSQYFASPEELLAHSREVHYLDRACPDEQRRYSCNICYQNLPNKNDIDDHEKQFREDLKKFHCEKCGKGFYRSRGLQIHLKSHDFAMGKCPMCPFVSMRPFFLKRHIERHSLPSGNYICLVCGHSYSSPALLAKHSTLHKVVTFKCPHCPLAFNTKSWLAKHISKHTIDGTANK